MRTIHSGRMPFQRATDGATLRHDYNPGHRQFSTSDGTPSPRICMPTFRGLNKKPFRCGLYEAQDVLVEVDDVELIELEQGWGKWFKESWLRNPLYHDASRKLMLVNPGLKGVRLTSEYELFVAVCQDFWDLPYLNAVYRWRDFCKTSVCWLDEIWSSTIPGYKHWLHALDQFDHIFVGCKGSVEALSRAINRPCHWLPGAVDAIRFSPFPNSPQRVIDVLSIGRRNEWIHRHLFDAATRDEMFYAYDTFSANDVEVHDHRQHRVRYADAARRSKYFVVAPGKMDDPQTGGQIEVGYRFFEGAASGTVMVGQPPDCEAFRDLFPWPDAVTPVQADGSDVMAVLAGLDSEPARRSEISRRNAREALLHHDWAHRWEQMFRVIGIEPSPRMAARRCDLTSLADLASDTGRVENDMSLHTGPSKPSKLVYTVRS